MTDYGASELAAVLRETQLAFLGLEANAIGVEGAKQLAAVLTRTTLEGVSLAPEEITEEGVRALERALKAPKFVPGKRTTSLLPKQALVRLAAKGIHVLPPPKVAPCGGVPTGCRGANATEATPTAAKAQAAAKGARGRTSAESKKRRSTSSSKPGATVSLPAHSSTSFQRVV